eukprot:g13691.t1
MPFPDELQGTAQPVIAESHSTLFDALLSLTEALGRSYFEADTEQQLHLSSQRPGITSYQLNAFAEVQQPASMLSINENKIAEARDRIHHLHQRYDLQHVQASGNANGVGMQIPRDRDTGMLWFCALLIPFGSVIAAVVLGCIWYSTAWFPGSKKPLGEDATLDRSLQQGPVPGVVGIGTGMPGGAWGGAYGGVGAAGAGQGASHARGYGGPASGNNYAGSFGANSYVSAGGRSGMHSGRGNPQPTPGSAAMM